MKTWIERALNVHPGDLGRGTLLCSSLFLIITAYKIGGVAAAALFLSRFQAKQLAYADIASSVLVTIVVAGYVRDCPSGSIAQFTGRQHVVFRQQLRACSGGWPTTSPG